MGEENWEEADDIDWDNFIAEHSQKMNEEEFRGRTSTEPDRDIKDTRKMQGQSPFIMNTGISFTNYD